MVVTKTSQDGRHEARVFAWQWAFCSASSLRCTRCVPVKTTPSFIYLEKPGKNRLLEITRLIRLALGLLVCVWILFQMFMPPKDPEGALSRAYRGAIRHHLRDRSLVIS